MYRIVIVFYLAFVATLIAGCAGNSVAAPDQSLAIPDATTSITLGDSRIGPMDTLQIEVFGVEELDGIYQVDFEGKLSVPLIQPQNVAGLTAGQLAVLLEERYEESYLQNPSVNVTIAESVGRRVTVDGSIRSPGLYEVTGRMTLLQAVAQAGGPSDGANPRKVAIFRQINGERHAAAFDLVAIRNGNADDPLVYGNDIIVVDGSEARRGYSELLRSLPLIALFTAF